MTIRPIIFSGEMVRALLAGRKTQTRRICRYQPSEDGFAFDGFYTMPDGVFQARLNNCSKLFTFKMPFAPGDMLYVRENCAGTERDDGTDGVLFPANDAFQEIANDPSAAIKWLKLYTYRGQEGAAIPSIHMPRWASRITLEVTGVKVERLQDISEDDARAEGVWYEKDINRYRMQKDKGANLIYAAGAFRWLWDSINAERNDGVYAWDANPWIVAVTFKVHHCNVDKMEKAA